LKLLKQTNILLIGASTGGPSEIEKIINSLPLLQNSAVVIAQHMPVLFLENFAKSLQRKTPNPLICIDEQTELQKGKIYLCKESMALDVKSFEFKKPNDKGFYNPDIETLFSSFTPLVREYEMMIVILTGIGDDGSKAALSLSKEGARVLTEEAKNCIVDGMPSAVRRVVPNAEAYSLSKIIEEIGAFCV